MSKARAFTRAGVASTALAVCLVTQAATSSPAATGTVAETEPGPVEAAHVALAGAVQPAATGHGADRVAVFVEPDAEQQRTLEVGDTLRMLELPASTVRRTGGSYAISVDPDSLPAGYVSDGGLVAFTVVGLGEDNRYRAVTHASARRVTVPGGTEATWVSPELPPQASAAAARDRLAEAPGATIAATRAAEEAPVRSDLVVRAVSADRLRGDQAATGTPTGPQARTATDADGTDPSTGGAMYASSTLRDTSDRSTTIGSTYPINRSVARMRINSGRATTTGVALYLGDGSWEQEGVQATEANFGKRWNLYGGARSYRVEVRYGKYHWCSEKYGYCETEWKPMYHTGGVGHNDLSNRPGWNTCTNVDAGGWWRVRSDGSAYYYGAGVKFRNVIGINLSSKRQYSTDNKLYYDVAGLKRMCGSGGRMPAVASKVIERIR